MKEMIRQKMTEAMKSRDKLSLGILRVIAGEVDTLEARGATIDDQKVAGVIRKLLESNKTTIAQMKDDDSRKAQLIAENDFLNKILPKTLDETEVIAQLASVADQIKAAKADGPAIGIAMKCLKTSGASVASEVVAAAVKQIRLSD